MKTTAKHLYPYISYNLKCRLNTLSEELVTIISIVNNTSVLVDYYGVPMNAKIADITPILRPLSSITEKEFEELNRIKNNDSIYIAITTDNYVYFECSNNDPYEGTPKLNLSTMNDIYEWFFKHHFNVFNLKQCRNE